MKRDVIIIAEGGCMQGVFGAGVMTTFHEANLNKRVHSIYASSSGAHNAAYFLSEQLSLGSSIYYEELTNGFIKLNNAKKYIRDIMAHRFKKNNICSIIDIDYLIETESNLKRLNAKKIKKHAANFYVRVFDIENLKFEYIDAKDDIFAALKSSSSSSPYYAHFVEINNNRYIDGSVINTKDFLNIIKDHNDKKIIIILNDSYSMFRAILTLPFMLIESLVFGILYGHKVMVKNIASTFNYPSKEELLKFKNVHIVASNKRYSKICTDKKKLLDLYNHGINKGKDLLKNLPQV